MPESPELAYSRDRIRKLIGGATITDVSPGLSGRYTKSLPRGLDDFTSKLTHTGFPLLESVCTHGKFMWWTFKFPDGSTRYMHCTYGMSGGWFTSPTKHTAFIVEAAPRKLFFNDPRHFGTIKFVSDHAEHAKKLSTLGPCILGSELTPEIFAENILKKPNRTIAEALMDQSAVAGVGNYIKAESAYRAGISPWRIVTEISPEEYSALCTHVQDVAQESYRSQGATISTYRTPDGSKGTTQFNFKIYSRKNCPLGHETLRETTPEGRTSWWCSSCQK